MIVRSLILVGLLMALPIAVEAQTALTAAELRQGLVGQWSGALRYRDYQSDNLVDLPVQTTITAPGDGTTLIRVSRFADGPGKTVWITTITSDNPATGQVVGASFRAGGRPQVETEGVTVSDLTDPRRWTLVYLQTGEDDDAPAEIRVTETRDGDVLTERKEVRPIGGPDTAWTFRNETRLTRIDD